MSNFICREQASYNIEVFPDVSVGTAFAIFTCLQHSTLLILQAEVHAKYPIVWVRCGIVSLLMLSKTVLKRVDGIRRYAWLSHKNVFCICQALYNSSDLLSTCVLETFLCVEHSFPLV
jgi:hypothetical protein